MAKKDQFLKKTRKLDRKQIEKELEDLRVELTKARHQVATGKEKNYAKLRRLKKDVARYLTLLKELKDE